jgi:FkbM family methyltransferase
MFDLKKAIRTAQNYFPRLASAKNDFYYFRSRYLGISHEPDFALIGALPRRPDDLFLDIGANRGQSILEIRRYRPDARIISFEPNPNIFRELKRRFGNVPGVKLEPYGLGGAATELTLYVPSYNGFPYDVLASFSSHVARDYLTPQMLYFFDPAKIAVQQIICPIRTLDGLGLAPSFIKIDVESFEYEVVRGGLETLHRHQPTLLFERHWEDPRMVETLTGLGYEEVGLRDRRIRRMRTESVMAIMMTADRLRDCGA